MKIRSFAASLAFLFLLVAALEAGASVDLREHPVEEFTGPAEESGFVALPGIGRLAAGLAARQRALFHERFPLARIDTRSELSREAERPLRDEGPPRFHSKRPPARQHDSDTSISHHPPFFVC